MGKTIKIFQQRNEETNTIENFHMKITSAGGKKGRGGGGTVGQNDPCMVITGHSKNSQ